MRSDLISRPRLTRPEQPPAGDHTPGGGVATAVGPLLVHFFGGPPPVRLNFWDGSALGPAKGDAVGSLTGRGPAFALVACGVGLARAFVMGDISFEGDIFELLAALHAAAPDRVDVGSRFPGRRCRRRAVSGSSAGRFRPRRKRPRRGAGSIAHGKRPGGAASLRRQQRLLRHGPGAGHDVLLRAIAPGIHTLEAAQESKHDLVCRKLGLADRPGQRILDVGCGWGSFALPQRGATGPGWWESHSARPRPGGPAIGSRPPDWRTRSRFVCRTIGTWVTRRSTASPRSAS